MILARFWEWWATWEEEWGWFPRWQGHRTTPKEKQSKPTKSEEKEKGQNPGCYKPSPLKEISSSRFGCSGNKYDLRTPFPTRVSFFLYLLFPQEFQMINLPWSGVACFTFPKFWQVFAHIPNLLLLTWIFSYLRWYPLDLSINFLLIMKTYLLLTCECFK